MVGSHLADYLINQTDWNIVGLIRWRSPLDNISHLLKEINENKRIKLVYGDLRDSISIDKVIKEVAPDYVFHLAAQSFPKTSFDVAFRYNDTNIQGTNRILESLRKYSRMPLYISVHPLKFLEEFQRINYQLTKNVIFIQHHLMQYRKLEQTL